MKLAALTLLITGTLFGDELPVITQPDLKTPLPKEWVVREGKWEVKDGVMSVAELPENKHVAVLWHNVPLQTGAVECEFMFDGAKVFILGCDGDRHIGRVVINPKSVKIVDDSTEIKGKQPGTSLAEMKADLKTGEWHKVRYEWNASRMGVTLDGKSIEATHENLGKKKARWWFAVGGATMKVRGVKVMGSQ